MSSPASLEKDVNASIVVGASIERAFEVFTADIGSWWPEDHHVLQAELAEMVFEPRAGGHIYDRGVDGSECRWARVLAYEPPTRVLFSWDIDLRWGIETDPDRASEVEVRFLEREPGARSSSWSTASSTDTVRAGRGCATPCALRGDGRRA